MTRFNRMWGAAMAVALTLVVHRCEATIVRFDTVLGDVDVRLFDSATPASVANFLNYVTDGDYTDSFIHRAPPGFVLQGGGYRWLEGAAGVSAVPTDNPVVNEPGLTNIRGTLAYAKLGGDPNSATSGWFFSVGNNAANLDFQNGGFTVFGRVVGDGLQVIDALASLRVVNAGSPFNELPVLDTFVSPTIFREDLVFINSVSVLPTLAGDYDFDGDVDAADLGVWEDQFGSTLRLVDGATQARSNGMEADGNGDGRVDSADYTVWRDAFAAASASQAIPEPAALGVALLTTLAAAARRRA